MKDINSRLNSLFESQLRDWKVTKDNYLALNLVEERELSFGIYTIRLQHNPKRSISTSADVSKNAVNKRPCFLCAANRPKEQKAIDYKGKYDILVNPFPIIPKHFTIASKKHIPQTINCLEDMFSIAKDLYDFSIVYNAPDSGASAPDHMHFQAGSKDFIQCEREIELIKKTGDCFVSTSEFELYEAKDYMRKCIYFESSDLNICEEMFSNIVNESCIISDEFNEPSINIVCRYNKNRWNVFVFPRKNHRSSHYYREDNLLVSPGVIDMGGVIICPRKKDFENISRQDIIEIFSEVSL